MLTINETIKAVENGGMWSVVEDVLYHLDLARTLESENRKLIQANTELTDAMAAYRCRWGEMYKEEFGKYPEYPF